MDETPAGGWAQASREFIAEGRVLVADAWAWLVDLFFLPGDALLGLLIEYLPFIASFFSIDAGIYGGWFSRVLSIAVWFGVLFAVGVIRSLDRTATAWVSGRFREGQRLLRILRRMIASRFWLLRQKFRSTTPDLDVSAVSLGRFEDSVLRCYSAADEFSVLAAEDIAARLGVPARHVKTALKRLAQLHLVQKSFSTAEGREGHVITRAGQIYVIEA